MALVRDNFADWRPEVGGWSSGLPLLSLDDLRAVPKETRIATRNRIQGWSDVRIQGRSDVGA